jgi:putative ABC transport system permease protein
MIVNYLKIASRNIIKRKLYSFINAFSLSIGIAFCILIFLFIQDEMSFDQFHVNKDRIYRMDEKSFETWQPDPEEPYHFNSHLQTGMMQALKDELPEVEFATRFNSGATGIFRFGEKVFTEKLTYVDPDFFSIFSFKLLKGNADKLFVNKSEIVLTSAIAAKYFGEEDPIGKTVLIDENGEKSFTVAGLIEAAPANSSLDFEILIPQENRPGYQRNRTNWGNFNTPTFVQLVSGADLNIFSSNLDKVVQKYMGDKLEKWRKESAIPVPADAKMYELRYTPLTRMHLTKKPGWNKASDIQYSIILGGMAVLILLIACINYVSLALTTSTARRTEVGIRKVVGAQKKQLIFQFGLESIALSIISMIIGLGLVALFLPTFNQFTGKEMSISTGNVLLLSGISFVLAVMVGVLAGSYPALFLSGFHPALVLKGRFTSRLQAGFTKPLVVLQFALSAFLIISSVIMYRQMKFVTTKDLGYDQSQVIVIPTQAGWNEESDKAVERFRSRMQPEPFIVSVAGTSSTFNQGYSHYGYKIDGEQRSAYVYAVDPYYIPTLDIQLLLGRNFDQAIASDTTCVIVNEALVADMKWKDPMNQYLNWKEDSVGVGARVIGVVKDYHFLSLEKNIEPMILSMDKNSIGNLTNILVKVAPSDIPGSIEKIRKAWADISPGKPFNYTFLDDDVARQYESYERWLSIMGLSTGFAILISCLGLFGLAGINAVNRTKEIGIRKVMGAELSNIFILLNRQYIVLSIVAFGIAAPVSYYVMNKWLEGFKFQIAIGWELFALSMVTGLFVALITVSYHAIKAALTNPAETLKYE